MEKEVVIEIRGGLKRFIIDKENRNLKGKFLGDSYDRYYIDLLKHLNKAMSSIFGNYKWIFKESQNGIELIAESNGTEFVESAGNTFEEAFWNCYQARTALDIII